MNKTIILLMILPYLFGCAVNRSVVDIQNVKINEASVDARNNPFVIHVDDSRAFVDHPSSPEIPSVGLNELANSDRSLLARVVGRKRNGFGKAMGDVFLPQDQTVNKIIYNIIFSIIERNGEIIGIGKGVPTETAIHVKIMEFWTYVDVKFTHLTLITKISTTLTVRNRSVTVSERVSNTHQLVTENDWKTNMLKALELYRKNAEVKLAELLRI